MKKQLVIGLSIMITCVLLSSCVFNSPEGCRGYVKVVSPIPDTSMIVGQSLERDIISNPIFQQTAGNNEFNYNVLNQDWLIVNVEIGNVTGQLKLTAKSAGIDTISIQAQDHCDTFAKTTFVVTVVDSSSH
ncbi:MAG TPA: hypothetical protein VKA34_11735 [Balneolales bacterium]|nr:hypothetical protein [Balneolales bacterium]